MPALIGYLVTLAVFLGGGYAGMQWLTAPADLPSAVAVNRSVEPVKSTGARVLARRRHEAAAEREASAKPMIATTPSASDEVAQNVVSNSANPSAEAPAVSEPARVETSQPADIVAAPIVEPPSTVKAAAIVGGKATIATSAPPDTPLDITNARTEAATAARAEAPRQAIGEPKAEKKVRLALARDDHEASDGKRGSVTKRRSPARLASRKPVMMILRTIEFPDGRREQRLLPMPRYRQALADD